MKCVIMVSPVTATLAYSSPTDNLTSTSYIIPIKVYKFTYKLIVKKILFIIRMQ